MSFITDMFSGGDAPQPPNPIATAAGQTSTNVASGVANAFLNQANQVTPQGNLTYSTDPSQNYSWNDPVTGVTYSIPRFTVTQTPPAEGTQERLIYDRGLATKANLSGSALNASTRIGQLLDNQGNPLASAPQGGDIAGLQNNPHAQFSIGDVGGQQRGLPYSGQQQGTFGDAGSQQMTFGEAGNVNRDRAETALYGRLQPQLQKDRANLEQRLADQGIRYGSEAYNRAMDDYNRQSTDARMAVTVAGLGEQQAAYQQALGRGQFANQAQQTLYEQMQGRGKFANEAQAQQFQQALQGGTFANQAQQQDFQQAALRGQFYNSAVAQEVAYDQQLANYADKQRNQYLAEQYGQRNQQFNEINALQTGSQLQAPSYVNTPSSSIATTDVAGLINNKFSQDLGIYQQQSANFNSLMGGIFGALGGIAKSDEKTKENVDRIGTIFAANDDGDKPIPIHAFNYKDEPSSARRIGPMAQDVEKAVPGAVTKRKGVKHVNFTKLGSVLRVA